jgi:glyoxalase superfamily protein
VASFIFNVTFDCAEPGALARFWAAVTGYSIIEEREDYAALAAPDQRGVRRILFFQVPEPKTEKSRMHVDLASREPESEIERLRSLGASLVDSADSPMWRTGHGTRWVVMRDPEGNEFCIG